MSRKSSFKKRIKNYRRNHPITIVDYKTGLELCTATVVSDEHMVLHFDDCEETNFMEYDQDAGLAFINLILDKIDPDIYVTSDNFTLFKLLHKPDYDKYSSENFEWSKTSHDFEPKDDGTYLDVLRREASGDIKLSSEDQKDAKDYLEDYKSFKEIEGNNY